jgi:hypothetical protein
MRRSVRVIFLLGLVPLLLIVLAACGGGDDDGETGPDGSSGQTSSSSDGGGGSSDASGTGGSSDDGSSGGTTVGAPTLDADPGMTWAEVEGQRIEYRANGSLHYECTVDDERVLINYQTAEGNDFSLNAALQGGSWIGNITFKPDGDGNIQYGATIPDDADVFGLGDGALSFEGTVDKITDRDIMNPETVDAQIAVNCSWPGGDPTAVIDGQTFTFPPSGAQSFSCSVADEAVSFEKSGGDSQLQIDAQMRTADAWLGSVAVRTAAGNYTSTIPEDGAGLTIDGATVRYEGTFTDPSGAEVTGTVDATCG